tara:strand:- start:8 stop:301 length:294 start_codon:yes stop_codon:yes gene_type:complete
VKIILLILEIPLLILVINGRGEMSIRSVGHLKQELPVAIPKPVGRQAELRNERQQANKQGIIAVARKLLILIYSLWKNNTTYDPNKNIPQQITLNTV